MAVPVYATDLTTINDGSGTFTEPAGAVLGTLSNADTDNFIQGASCASKSTGASGAPALAGIGIQAGAAQTITSPNAFYAWVFTGAGALIATLANGGIRLIIGQDINNYRYWYVDGSDFFPYVGWQCIAIETDNAVVAATGSQGTPTATKQYFGVVFSCLINISKGNPMALDAIRWGRTITVTFGETSNYATFNGIALTNDTNTNRWGQFQAITGGYQLQGKLLLGVTGGNVVDFRDSNVNIVIAISRKTASTFNAVEIQNASSRVDWTAVNFTALGTVSRGDFTVTDDADVNWVNCTFTDVGLFSLKPATGATNCIFRRTDKITTGGATLTGCTIDNNRATTAVLASSPANAALVSGCTFNSDGTGHGLEITGAVANMTLTGCTWTGYAGSDGSSGNEAVYVNTSAGSMNLTISGGTTPSIRVAAGVNVTVITSSRTIKVVVTSTAGAVTGANVFLAAAAGGPFPSNVTVTITRSGTTATVSHTDHGMATNDQVNITGITDKIEDNGVHTITYIGVNSYSYTTTDSGSTSYTGTIKCTFVFLKGLATAGTNSNEISMTRAIPSSQPVTGWARKSTSAPYYKEGAISGTVSSSGDTTFSPVLISDD